MPSWFAEARAVLMVVSDVRVKGALREMMEEDGEMLGAVVVTNVLNSIFCRFDLDHYIWMLSKRPTQNVRSDGTPCLFVFIPRLDRLILQDQGPENRRGYLCCCLPRSVIYPYVHAPSHSTSTGREASTSRKVAIKKIKVGQFKDGLDMSAIREVKYLRELHHQNIIEVSNSHCSCILHTMPPTHPKLMDVFSSKTNLNLVLEFLDTDLEIIIKDRTLVFLPADIKSWMAMTFRGLEFCHRNFILHRVRSDHSA